MSVTQSPEVVCHVFVLAHFEVICDLLLKRHKPNLSLYVTISYVLFYFVFPFCFVLFLVYFVVSLFLSSISVLLFLNVCLFLLLLLLLLGVHVLRRFKGL